MGQGGVALRWACSEALREWAGVRLDTEKEEAQTLGLDVGCGGCDTIWLNLGNLGCSVEHSWGTEVSLGRQLGISKSERPCWCEQVPRCLSTSASPRRCSSWRP